MGAHAAGTRLLSVLLLVIGGAMVVSTVARGGGPFASGVILGILFFAAGAARLYVALRSDR